MNDPIATDSRATARQISLAIRESVGSAAPLGLANVRDFGARGDGETDDTRAVLAAVSSERGALFFPPGAYVVSETVEIRPAQGHVAQVRGCGGASKLVYRGTGPALRVIGTHAGTASPDSVSAEVWDRELMPVLCDLHLEGNEQADGLELLYTFKAVVSRVAVHRCRHGVHLVKRNRNVILSDCHLYHNAGFGVFLDEVDLHQINILGSHLSYNRAGGIRVLGGNVRNLQITGNALEYNNAGKGAAVGSESADVWITGGPVGMREGTLTGNTIQATVSPGGANIRLEGDLDHDNRKAGHFAIAGNLISNQETNLLVRHARGIVIAGNAFFHAADRNVRIEDSAQVVVANNTFDDNPDYRGHSPVGIGGLALTRCFACTVSNCILTEPHGGKAKGAAIQVLDSSAINVNNCTVVDSTVEPIRVKRTTDSEVTGCLVTSARAAAQ